MTRIARATAFLIAAFAATASQAVIFSLVSLRSDGTAPADYTDNSSSQPAITPDGRYVVFSGSSSNLVNPGVTGTQIYLRDRVAGTTELISVGTAGEGGNGFNEAPSISDDGCKVVFVSNSTNLVAGDTNASQDVFVRNRCTQPATTSLVSVSTAGVQGNLGSHEARISGDGSRVVFMSFSTNLATVLGQGGSRCIFVRNLNASTTIALTTPAGACIAAATPDISADGSRVAFWAQYDPGTVNRINGVWQIFLYDFSGSQITVISTNAAGTPQSQGIDGVSTVSAPGISPDGGFVAFPSCGAGLVTPDDSVNCHVYVKNIATGAIVRASVSSAGVLGNANSSRSGQGYRPGISRQGRTVTFLTNATNLAPETGGFYPNVVAHDLATGRTVGFSSNLTIGGWPNVTAGGELIVAYSGSQLDPAFARRGMFVFPGMTGRLGNISTRGQVQTGNNVMIGGFVIGGSTAKTVLVRARGPSMIPAGVTNAMANPQMTLVNQATNAIIATNDDWGSASNAAAITATGKAPTNALESAILMSLAPGAYTAVVSGVNNGVGVGIIEVFEVDGTHIPLVNISTRGRVLTGNDVMIGGFIIDGSLPQQVLIRARGPSMIPAGVTDALPDPTMTLVNQATNAIIATNDNWSNASNASAIAATGLSPTNPLESAILMTLEPGAYTVVVSGVNNGVGVGIVEVFAQ